MGFDVTISGLQDCVCSCFTDPDTHEFSCDFGQDFNSCCCGPCREEFIHLCCSPQPNFKAISFKAASLVEVAIETVLVKKSGRRKSRMFA